METRSFSRDLCFHRIPSIQDAAPFWISAYDATTAIERRRSDAASVADGSAFASVGGCRLDADIARSDTGRHLYGPGDTLDGPDTPATRHRRQWLVLAR